VQNLTFVRERFSKNVSTTLMASAPSGPLAAEATVASTSAGFDIPHSMVSTCGLEATNRTARSATDSAPTSFDKLSVREGRYGIWGPLHFFARVTGGVPSAAAGAAVARFAAAKIEQELIDTEIQKHLVPRCAMRVTRTEEMGTLKPYSPDYQCHCYFEKVANGSTKCQTCTGPGDCPSSTPACNYGYCEAQ